MRRKPLERVHAWLLCAYPKSFRARFGGALQRDFAQALTESAARGCAARWRTVLVWNADALWSGVGERLASFRRGRAVRRHMRGWPAAGASERSGGGMGMDGMGRDVRIAVRRMARQPGLVAVVVLTLALAIGAATTVFLVIDALFLRALAYPDAHRLVMLQTVDARGRVGTKLSQPDARDVAAMVGAFESVAVFDWGAVALAGGGGEPEMVRSAHVSASFFEALGVTPVLGRSFEAAHDEPGRGDVVLLSDGLWRRRFGADADVIGRTVSVSSRPHTVIGVLPRGFEDPASAGNGYAELYLPLALQGGLAERSARWLGAIAKLAPGETLAGSITQLEAASARLADAHPETNEGVVIGAVGLQDALFGEARGPLVLLFAATIAVLLIACSNLANLMLARGAFRRHEIAVQRAIGAGSGVIARQLLVESVLLALAGGLAGIGLTYGAAGAGGAALGERLPRLASATPSLTVLAFALAISFLAALLFGLLPSLHLLRAAPAGALDRGRGVVAGSTRSRTRRGLVAVQVTLSVVLLAGAALLLRSVGELMRVDAGFETASRVSAELILPSATYPDTEQVIAFYDRLDDAFTQTPGVLAVGAIDKPPLGTRWGCAAFAVEGAPLPDRPESWPCADSRAITAGYLAAAGTPLVLGRAFAVGDDERAPSVALVNEALANQLWPGQDALGKRVAWAHELEGEDPWRTVVGVVADVRQRGPATPPAPAIYVPFRQAPDRRMTWIVRSAGSPLALVPAMRSALRALDPTLPLRQPRTLEEAFAESIGPQRSAAAAVGAIAAFALLLALVGIHGVLSFIVAQRTAEIGVRMAFGATSRDVLRSVLRDGLVTVAVATGVGLVLAVVLARVLAQFLYGVAPADPLSFGAVAVLVTGAALVACGLPARRAARLDPTVALRAD